MARERTWDSKSTPRVNSRQWQTMRGVTKALSSLRPTGCSLWLTSRAQFTHHYGKGREARKVGAPHQLHGKLRSHYLCAYTRTRAALGHATLCHATVLCSGYRWPDKEDINNAFCTNTTDVFLSTRSAGVGVRAARECARAHVRDAVL